MRLPFFGLVVVLTSATALPSFTSAQPPARQPAATAEDGDARSLFQMGQTAFGQGRFDAALDYFQRAYDLSHRPELLFNVGQAADRLRDDRRALAAFEGFLAQVPVSPQRESTEARVQVLRASIAAQDAAAAEAEEQAATHERERAERAAADATREVDAANSHRHTIGWIVAGSGVAALAVGGTFLALGLGDKSTVEDARDGTVYASVEDEYERASTRITVGTILLGVGAAATATGLTFALTSRDADEAPTALRLQVLPNGLLLRRAF